MTDKKTDAQWKEILDPELYHVARNAGTQAPFTGKYTDVYTQGAYHCACCDAPLFESTMKFPTHCGWPGFAKPIKGAGVNEHVDTSIIGRPRTEVTCDECDAHLGHVFPDGPAEMGGLRYCINSISLVLKETDGKPTAD